MILDFREPFKIDQTFNTQKIDILFSLKVPPFSFLQTVEKYNFRIDSGSSGSLIQQTINDCMLVATSSWKYSPKHFNVRLYSMDYGYSEEEQWNDKTPCVNLLPQNLSISEVISKHDLFIYTLMGVRDGLKSEPLLFQFAFSLTHAGRLFHHVFSSILTICSLLEFFTQQRNR